MKKGFTLVELLGVIVILGVLALVATNLVSNTMKETKDDLYKAQIENILTGAKIWASANVMELPENDGDSVFITLQQLKQAGMVEENITDPLTEEPFSNEMKIKITRVGNNYTYKIVE